MLEAVGLQEMQTLLSSEFLTVQTHLYKMNLGSCMKKDWDIKHALSLTGVQIN